MYINRDAHDRSVLPAGPGVNMPTPHDAQELCLALKFQCREEGSFKAGHAWATGLGETVRLKPDDFDWRGGGRGGLIRQ